MEKILRTPESRFENLQGYDFTSHYLDVEKGLRMHYLDEGSKANPAILLLHGEPTWSYLYRKMIPLLAKGNFRVIAPDLIGFGKSDKWVERNQYTYQKHIEWLKKFILTLDLKDITLFCQDWGGLLGLRIAVEMPERFSGIVASNTTLPTGQGTVPEAFMQWREFSQKSSEFNIGRIVSSGTLSPLSDEVRAGYDAPFPSEAYKAGARIFPVLVPIAEDDPETVNNKKAWQLFAKWEKPFLTVFGDGDMIMMGAEKAFHKLVPGAKNQKHQILHAGHFIQEEQAEELAKILIDFMRQNRD